MVKNISLFLIGLMLSSFLVAQKKYTTKDIKAINAFEKGIDHFYGSSPMASIKEFEKAVKIAPDFIEPLLMLGDIYSANDQKEKAITYYQRVLDINPEYSTKAWLVAGNIYFDIENYPLSLNSFQIASEFALSEDEKILVERYIKQIKFIIHAMENPVDFNPVNMGENINTPFHEYLPSLTSDAQTLIFTRRFPRTENTIAASPEEEDLYISQRKNNIWGKAQRMPEPVNSYGNEGSQCVSQDGRYLFFTACNRPDGFGSCDIYICEKEGDQWSAPKNLGREVNSSAWETQPSLSIDGKTLYFVSNRKGGKGGSDIWKTTLQPNGRWSTPENLGDSINTPGNEASPFIHYDNRTLFFSSDGHIGMGGADVFSAKRKNNNTWSTPKNLGYPINTKHDESCIIVEPDGKIAIIASDKFGGYGKQDLYAFELHKAIRPTAVTYMKGYVYDQTTQKPLASQFEIIDLETGETIASASSDRITGNFLISLPTNRNYALNVSSDKYLFYSDYIELINSSEKEPFLKDIPLKPIKVGESVVLKNVFFDVNKYNLKEESKIELDKLISLLIRNTTLKIEIGGHTDNTGDEKSNQILSENRAKSVYHYLIDRSIPASQLTFKGYGQANPINPNDTEQGRANNRRTEFKIIAK